MAAILKGLPEEMMQIEDVDEECCDGTHYDHAANVSDTSIINNKIDTQFEELSLLHNEVEMIRDKIDDLYSRNASIQAEMDRVTYYIFMLIAIGFGILYAYLYI